jgi:hypothetical protein
MSETDLRRTIRSSVAALVAANAVIGLAVVRGNEAILLVVLVFPLLYLLKWAITRPMSVEGD